MHVLLSWRSLWILSQFGGPRTESSALTHCQSCSQHLHKEGKAAVVSLFLEKSSVLLLARLLGRVLGPLLPSPRTCSWVVGTLNSSHRASPGDGWCGGLHVAGGCSHARPPGDGSFRSENPNIALCDQVLTKKWSNPYLGRVQGLKFLTASFPGSAACAALKASESQGLCC